MEETYIFSRPWGQKRVNGVACTAADDNWEMAGKEGGIGEMEGSGAEGRWWECGGGMGGDLREGEMGWDRVYPLDILTYSSIQE